MKKIFSNNRLIAFAFFTVFSVSLNPALALDFPKPVPVELKFIGTIRNQPLFQLSFAGSPEQDHFTILVKDEYGNPLYRENIIGRTFSKKFLLNTEEIGQDLIRFEITCRQTGQSVLYEVNAKTRIIKQWVVAETGK